MKKFTPLLLLLLAFMNLQGQTVTNTQTTLITKRTADWCPYCGTYGWQFTTQLKPKLVGKDGIMWNVHYSGGLATNTSKAIAANIGGVGQPLIFLNTETDDIGLNASNVAAKVDEVAQWVDDLSLFGALIGMGGEAKVNPSNELTAKAKVKFYDSAENGEFYLGFYLVKKNLVAFQQSVGQNAVHHAVLDQSLTEGFFGNKIGAAPVSKGAEFETSASLANLVLHNGKLEDTKVVMVLWNKLSTGKYIFLNAREVDLQLTQTTSAQDIDQTLSFTAKAGSDYIDVLIDDASIDPTAIRVYDVNGHEFKGQTSKADNHSYRINGLNLVPGVYFVKLEVGHKTATRQVFYTH